MTKLANFINRVSEISIKNPTAFIAEMNKLFLKYVWKRRRLRIDKNSLAKEEQS